MSLETLTIVILIVGFVGMSCWVVVLDTRNEQLKGGIKRLEREIEEMRNDQE